MTKKELIKQLESLCDDDAVVISMGNSYPMFKITHVEDSTMVGVYEIRYTEFETNNPWEE